MDNVGYGLYKFKDKIYQGDDVFALTYDFTQEVPSDIRDFKLIMDKVKDLWKTLTIEEKREVTGIIQDMLDEYIEYLSLIHLA
jgi:hypothetical protein